MNEKENREVVEALRDSGDDGCCALHQKAAEVIVEMQREITRLRGRVDELLNSNTEKVLELRATDRKRMVREFFAVAGQPMRERPGIPPPTELLRLTNFVVEECCELVDAMMVEVYPHYAGDAMREAYAATAERCAFAPRMPEVIDAVVDVGYVAEAVPIAFGVDLTPVWLGVHRANLLKAGGPKRASDGKLLKPPGWQPFDVEGELRRQGWRP